MTKREAGLLTAFGEIRHWDFVIIPSFTLRHSSFFLAWLRQAIVSH
jgi:hypothetical protein